MEALISIAIGTRRIKSLSIPLFLVLLQFPLDGLLWMVLFSLKLGLVPCLSEIGYFAACKRILRFEHLYVL